MNDTNHHIKIKKWLYPISFLYGIGVRIRNSLFNWNILKSKTFKLPIICIGNLTVGGTGKTPHTEYILSLLQKDYHSAVLSRGYKRKTKGYILASSASTAQDIGDEPYQIKQKFPNTAVAVDANRCRGISELIKLDKPQIDVILLDDAYQHRYVNAGLNILLTDYNRLICDDKLLPAGYLREPIHEKNRANIVIVTKCPHDIKPIDYNIIGKRLDLYPFQKLYFSTLKYGQLYPIFETENTEQIKLENISTFDNVLLLTGIANPKYLIEEITKHTDKFSCLSYKDHHQFTENDIKNIEHKFNAIAGEEKIIITTEKDAMRLIHNPHLSDKVKAKLYIIPIEIEILQDKQTDFNKNILDYVREDKRNC